MSWGVHEPKTLLGAPQGVELLLVGFSMSHGVTRPEAEAIATVVAGEFAAAPVTVEAAYELARRVETLSAQVVSAS